METLLSFKKTELVNLENSLKHEIISSNRAGGYTCTTIVGCNTRKYHGLLVCPLDEIDGESYVLLSSLDETLIQQDKEFNLATHKYPGIYSPRGHKYIREFHFAPTPTTIFRIGDIIVKKELIVVHEKAQVLLKYTLEEAEAPTKLRLRPMLAFRCRHKLSKANLYVNKKHKTVDNGIASKLYENFPFLYMQLNRKNDFIENPDWYFNVEYEVEEERGYPFQEDLFSPGYFEVPLKKGESIVFSASLDEEKSAGIQRVFNKQLENRPPKITYKDCMVNAAQQFVAERGGDTEIIAGFPWFGRWGRDTFIALPGLTLSDSYKPEVCKAVLDTMSNEMHNGLFPNIGKNDDAAYNSVDAPMWYFWAIQKYIDATNKGKEAWKDYGDKMKDILNAFRFGSNQHIGMHDNGLIWAKEQGKALTWMDALVFGEPVTQRGGYAVDINLLWYNAVQFTLELAQKFGDKKFVSEWKDLPELVKNSFNDTFWNDEHEHLADYVDEHGQNMDLRPNQVIATSMPYSPISDTQKKSILRCIQKELLTPKGLRSLTPEHPNYKGVCKGDQPTRDRAYHQGTVWVWQLGHFAEGNFNLYGKDYVRDAKKIIENFEKDVAEYGLAGVAEIYDGNPPHHPGGSISQAWSVSEILRIMQMIEKYEEQ